jgi:hypothetical protein
MITNAASGTNVHEIAPGIFRINPPIAIPGGSGFSFNQYLIADEAPLVFHTGPRKMFPLLAERIDTLVLPQDVLDEARGAQAVLEQTFPELFRQPYVSACRYLYGATV